MYGAHTLSNRYNSFKFRLILIDLNLCRVVPDRNGEAFFYAIGESDLIRTLSTATLTANCPSPTVYYSLT